MQEIDFFNQKKAVNTRLEEFEVANSNGKRISYLDFLQKQKIDYQSYLQTMTKWFDQTIEKVSDTFQTYSKFKLNLEKTLVEMAKDKKKLRVFNQKKDLIVKIVNFLTSDVVLFFSDLKKAIEIHHQTLKKIMDVLCAKGLFERRWKLFYKQNVKVFVVFINQKIKHKFKGVAFI